MDINSAVILGKRLDKEIIIFDARTVKKSVFEREVSRAVYKKHRTEAFIRNPELINKAVITRAKVFSQ